MVRLPSKVTTASTMVLIQSQRRAHKPRGGVLRSERYSERSHIPTPKLALRHATRVRWHRPALRNPASHDSMRDARFLEESQKSVISSQWLGECPVGDGIVDYT
jgi:hypothetical protein